MRAAAVVGGTSLNGGRGSVIGMIIGAALIRLIENGLILAKAPGFYIQLFVGLIIVIAAVFNKLMEGKTLVKIMSGVVPMTSGAYYWDGAAVPSVNRPTTEALGVETIFQDSALVDQMSITRNIFMGREITNLLGFMKLKQMDAIATNILDTVVTIEGIKSSKQLVSSLSGGQAQAVAIARPVHFKRSLLILDVRREDTSVEELTAAVVEGQVGVDRFRAGATI